MSGPGGGGVLGGPLTREVRRGRGGGRNPPTGRRLAVLAVLLLSLLVPSVAAGDTLSITPSIRGTPGANGWYRSKVTVNWGIQPMPDSSRGCDAFTPTGDPRGPTRASPPTLGGPSINHGIPLKIDATA